jgi:hypothetical protein
MLGVIVHRGENDRLISGPGRRTLLFPVTSAHRRVKFFVPVVEEQAFDGRIATADLFALFREQAVMPLFSEVFDGADFADSLRHRSIDSGIASNRL